MQTITRVIYRTLLFSLSISLYIASYSASAYSDKHQSASRSEVITSHAIAMHGKAKYPHGFERFEYTSSKAIKGGAIKLYGLGTFDSLNPYIAKGNAASNVDLLFDSLTTQAWDEPFTQYGLLAHTIEYPKDRSWVIFHLRPEARFHDGHPVSAEDVVFSFNILLDKGSPSYKFYYADVKKVEALDAQRVKFTFKGSENREMALSVGSLPVFPKHFWQDKAFEKSSLDIPLGSGPYKIHKIDAGRNITFQRVSDYWGQNLSVNKGSYNFDVISVDYYRDNNVAVEALKAGEYDFRREFSSKFWATAYDVPAVNNGQLVTREVTHNANSGIQAFVFNLRQPIFQDIELRKAIAYAFDFEWSNKTLFYGAYQRSYSFFTNSEFAATQLPDEKELALLLPHKDQLPSSVFTTVYAPPKTDGSGYNRPSLRAAKKLLDAAGYSVKNNQLMNAKGQPIRFEILLRSAGFERIVNPFIKSLSRLGITANIRLVDSSQYVNRSRSFDFDMLVNVFQQSESPGNEQRNLWSSPAAEAEGSYNLAGIKNPVIDQLIEHVTNAKNRDDLVIATRALDRVLLHYHYVIPQWYKSSNRLAYWDKFNMPDITPIYDRYYSTGIYTWWYDADKVKKLKHSP